MFFSWYAKNKYFKKGNNLSGQIIPFLLIVLVILLIAALTTIKIGNVAVRKTCSANSADAGSLAAASVLAAAFNNVMLTNYEVAINFEMTRITLDVLKDKAGAALDEADDLIAEAKDQLTYANLAIVAGAVSHIPCTPWVQYGFITAFLIIAETKIHDAENKIQEYINIVTEIKIIVDQLKDAQLQNFCMMKAYMDQAFVEAERIGLQFAKNNNCGAEVASASIVLPSISYEVRHSKRNYPTSLKVDIPAAIGNFINQIVSPVANMVNQIAQAINSIRIPSWLRSAIRRLFSWLGSALNFISYYINKFLSLLNIPNLVNNFVKGIIAALTITDDPFGIKTASFYKGVLDGFFYAFIDPIVAAGVIVTASTAGALACAGVITLPAGLIDFTALYSSTIWTFYIPYLLLWGTFNLFIDHPIDDLSIKRLREHLEEIAQVWEDNGDSQFYLSSSCDDVSNEVSFGGGDSADPMAKGLMIYELVDINLSSWTVTCRASVGSSSSSCTSKFDGGGMSIEIYDEANKYYPRIISVN